MRQHFLDAFTARFGPLTVNLETVIHTVVEFFRLSSGGVLFTQDRAIARAASEVGVSHFPSVILPADEHLFASCEGVECESLDSTKYSSLLGKLVHVRLVMRFVLQFRTCAVSTLYQ